MRLIYRIGALLMNIQSTRPKPTPYRKIMDSKVGKMVRDNKVATGATGVAATAVIAGGAFQSDGFAQVARYGILPAVGAGVSVLGAAAVHDAIVNDVGENNLKATAKIATGTVAALGGAQVVGAAYDIPVLDEALTGVVFDHGQGLLGAGLLSGAYVAGKASAHQFAKVSTSENKAVPIALGTGAAIGATGAGLAGAELVGRDLDIPVLNKALTGTVEFLAQSPAAAVVGGGLLVGGAAVAGAQVVKNLADGKGNDYATAAMAAGTAAGGLGGLELMGHGLGLEATKGLFTDNADLVGSLALSALAGAVTKHAVGKMQKDGVTALRALALTGGVSGVGGGLSLAALSIGANGMTDFLGNATSVAAGAGLGISAYAFGKQTADSLKKGKVGTAIFHGAGAFTTAAGGLTALGHGLGIPALEQAGEKIVQHTVKPLAEHVLLPTLEFFFENPVVGGLGLAAIVGGFAYSQLKD
jgi:hypothetical protein